MVSVESGGSRGAAARVFAAEFSLSDLLMPGQGGPGELVTRTGAWCGRMYIVGALTEVIPHGEQAYARIADPTGVFDIRTAGNQRSIATALSKMNPPQWVAVLGSGQAPSRQGPGQSCFIRPGEIRVVDRTVRDSWLITTSAVTLSRVRTMIDVLEGRCSDPDLVTVAGRYGICRADLMDILRLTGPALSAAQPVTSVPVEGQDIRTALLDLIGKYSGPKGIPVTDLVARAGSAGIDEPSAMRILKDLIGEDEVYQPSVGMVRLL